MQLAQQRADAARGREVEVAGGLVGEENVRLREERAGDGDALALAAGELRGAAPLLAGEAEAGE